MNESRWVWWQILNYSWQTECDGPRSTINQPLLSQIGGSQISNLRTSWAIPLISPSPQIAPHNVVYPKEVLRQLQALPWRCHRDMVAWCGELGSGAYQVWFVDWWSNYGGVYGLFKGFIGIMMVNWWLVVVYHAWWCFINGWLVLINNVWLVDWSISLYQLS